MMSSRWTRVQKQRLYFCLVLAALSLIFIYAKFSKNSYSGIAVSEPAVHESKAVLDVPSNAAMETLRRDAAVGQLPAVEKLDNTVKELGESVQNTTNTKENALVGSVGDKNSNIVSEVAILSTTTTTLPPPTSTSTPSTATEHLRVSPSTAAVEQATTTTTVAPDDNKQQKSVEAGAPAAATSDGAASTSNWLRPVPFFDGRKWSNPDGEASIKPFPMDIEFVFNNPELCKVPDGGRPLDWLVYFHSKPDNVEKRKHLRATWANENLFNDTTTRRVFFFGLPLGRAEEKQLLSSLAAEYAEYKDIVVGNFIDNYNNLTLKSVMALKWVSTYCTNAKHAIKSDEDIFVNIVEVTSLILSQPKQNRLITCPIFYENSMPILRDPKNCMKWCVGPDEFPGDSMFPRYCSGSAYAFSIDIAADMYRAAMGTRFFFIDDVYTMGLLPLKLPYNKQLTWVDIPFEYESDRGINDYATGGIAAKFWVIMTSRMEAYDYYFTRMLRKLNNKQVNRLNPALRKEHGLL
jgi:hypothetical protein